MSAQRADFRLGGGFGDEESPETVTPEVIEDEALPPVGWPSVPVTEPADEPRPAEPIVRIPKGPVPTSGWRGLLWRLIGSRLYVRFGWRWLIKLSLRDRLSYALDELWQLRADPEVRVLAFLNSSGGSGKTTSTTWLSAAAASAFKGTVAAIDANDNAGHTAERFGVGAKPEEIPSALESQAKNRQLLNGVGTIRLREFIDRRHQFVSFQSLLPEVDRHRQSGVFVIASNRVDDSDIGLDDFKQALGILKASFRLVCVDTGNGLKNPTNYGSVQMADRLVFVGNAFKHESLEDIGPTMERYANLGCEDKVKRGFVMVFGANPRRRKKFAADYGLPIEQVFVIPVSRYMRYTGNIVLIQKLSLRLRVILFESLVAILKSG